MKIVLLTASSALAAALASTAAQAEADGGDAGGEQQILVIGHSEGYGTDSSSSSLRTDTPLLDTPQSVVVVSRQQLDDQAQRSMADVLRYVPGVTIGQGEGNRDQITLRGQNTTADFFVDGIRDDVQYFRGLYNIERVEVLKGASALAFGRGGGGGVINRVQKAPSAERAFGAIEAGVDSFGSWEIAADGNVPLSATAGARLNAFYEELASHRDFVGGERWAVNPALGAEIAPGWLAGLSYEFVHDDRMSDRGVPSLACTQPCTPAPLPGQRDTFFGVPGVNRTGIDAHVVKARLDGKLAPNLSWSTSVLYGDYDKFYTNVFANGAASAVNGTVALAGYVDATRRENLFAQTNLVAELDLGATSHKVLFGLEYGDQSSTNTRRNAVLSNGTLNLANIVYPTVTFPVLNTNRVSDVNTLSAYLQDQIGLGEIVEIVAGLRYDRFDISGTDIAGNNRAFGRVDHMWSPRLGLVVKPRREMSLYASYSRSFLPRSGDQFLTLTTTNQNLAPEEFTNYEIGAKWDIRPGFNVTAAVFQLDRTNTATPDPANPLQSIVVDTRTRGAEIAVAGRILPNWQVSGGYTYQDATRRHDGTIRLGQVPEHQFALWNRYDLSGALGLGLGVVHQSSQFAAIRTAPTVTRLPAFTRVDAALFWKPNERFEMQLNVENLLDETYFASAHNVNNISPGAPINARLTGRVRF